MEDKHTLTDAELEGIAGGSDAAKKQPHCPNCDNLLSGTSFSSDSKYGCSRCGYVFYGGQVKWHE